MAKSKLVRWLKDIFMGEERPLPAARPSMNRNNQTAPVSPNLQGNPPVSSSAKGTRPANPSGSSRIQWTDVPPAKPQPPPVNPSTLPPTPARPEPPPPQRKPVSSSSGSGKIEWGGGGQAGGASFDPASLIGVEDAYEHTPILAGEQVAYCTYDKVAYHLETWQFLRSQNRSACCICGRIGTIKLVQIPGGTGRETPVVTPAVPRVSTFPGGVIHLAQVPEHVGRAVTVQAFVYDVYKTKSTGTIFVRFEPREAGEAVFDGFKLVIFPDYQNEWTKAGSNIFGYKGKYIRVRGVVQVHPKWGIEILVNSPRVIEVVDGPKEKGK